MSADLRDFTEFDKFGGSIVNGVYQFPKLYTVDTNKNTRFFLISVGLLKSSREGCYDKSTLQELLKEKVSMKESMLMENPLDYVAFVWTESGVTDGKHTSTEPTIIYKGSFIGNANERTTLQRALISARAKFLKKKETGSVEDKLKDKLKDITVENDSDSDSNSDENDSSNNNSSSEDSSSESDSRENKKSTKSSKVSAKTPVKSVNILYFPMLAHLHKIAAKHLKYPLYVQRKYDGTRCIGFLRKAPASNDISTIIKDNPSYIKDSVTSNDVVLYTRNKKVSIGMDYIREAMFPILVKYYDLKQDQSIYLDGELYRHGKRLQDIVGESRNIKKNMMLMKKDKSDDSGSDSDSDSSSESNDESESESEDEEDEESYNQYFMYDCFYPKNLDTPYKERYKLVQEIFETMPESSKTWIKCVETFIAKNFDEAETLFNKFVDESYEGAILRDMRGVYLADSNKTSAKLRSKHLAKLKKKYTDEFKCIGYKDGNGRDRGAVIWQCITKGGTKFNVTPKDMTMDERKAVFKMYGKSTIVKGKKSTVFDDKYKNHMLTIEYESLSAKGVPQRGKGVVFRDYE